MIVRVVWPLITNYPCIIAFRQDEGRHMPRSFLRRVRFQDYVPVKSWEEWLGGGGGGGGQRQAVVLRSHRDFLVGVSGVEAQTARQQRLHNRLQHTIRATVGFLTSCVSPVRAADLVAGRKSAGNLATQDAIVCQL